MCGKGDGVGGEEKVRYSDSGIKVLQEGRWLYKFVSIVVVQN